MRIDVRETIVDRPIYRQKLAVPQSAHVRAAALQFHGMKDKVVDVLNYLSSMR